MKRALLAAAASLLLIPAAHGQTPRAADYITPFDIDGTRILPPPPADGSPRQQAEIAEVRRLAATRTPEQFAKAKWDDTHENVTLFYEVLGPGFDIDKLPATKALLKIVDDDREKAEGAKKIFLRQRPWAFDPTIVSCDTGQNKDPRSSYPSGHSLTGYSLGLMLATLLPEKAQVIEARAADYAYNREICASHYHSDTEASHVLAAALVTTLLKSPAMQPKIAAARAELRAAHLTGGGTIEDAYRRPHLARGEGPVSVTFDGKTYIDKGLVGVGRLSASLLDFTGDSLGSFSGLAVDLDKWKKTPTGYAGVLYTLPDRGPNDVGGVTGTTDYHNRVNAHQITFRPYVGPALGASTESQRQLVITPDGGMLLKDSVGAMFTGKDPGGNVLVRDGVSLPSPAKGDGAGHISLDSESIARLADGSFYVSDEYAAAVYYFSAAGDLVGVIAAPPALMPMVGGKIDFGAEKPPQTGRRNNQGLEGVSVTPDGKTLVTVLQSATVQDSGKGAETRNNTRILVYDLSKGRVPKMPVAHYVLHLPTVSKDGVGGALDATAAVSEITALDAKHFLVLSRDSVGRGGDSNAADSAVFRSVLLVSAEGATNLAGTRYETSAAPVSPGGVLDPSITPTHLAELVNLLNPQQLGRFGINLKTNPSDPMSLSEKWEGMTLAPVLDPKAPNDVLLMISNDNDFVTAHGRLNGQDFDASIKPPKGMGENDNLVLVYRLTLPGFAPKPAAR